MQERIRIGISRCLLGEKVRYDGGDQANPFLTDTLGRHVDYVPVCPEVEIGLAIPREPMRLVGDSDAPRLMTIHVQRDYTRQMATWAHKRIRELEKEELCGFIFKKDSPSCGLFNVKVYNDKGMPSGKGRGIFAHAFTRHFALVPVEEDGRLRDPRLREAFIERIFAMRI